MSFKVIWQKIVEFAMKFYNYVMTQGESDFMLINSDFMNGSDIPEQMQYFFIGSFIVMVLLAIFACDSFSLFDLFDDPIEFILDKGSIVRVVIFSAAIFSFHTFYKMLVGITGRFLGADASTRALSCLGSYINPIAIMIYAFAITTLYFKRRWFQAFMLGLVIFLTPSVMSFYEFTNEHIAIYSAAGAIAFTGGVLYVLEWSPFVACFVLDIAYFVAKYFMIFYSDEVKLITASDNVGRIKQYLACVQMDLILALILLLVLFVYNIATTRNASVKKNVVLPIVLAIFTIMAIIFGRTELRYQPDYEQAVALWDDKKYEEAMHAFEDLNGYKDSQEYIDQCIEEISRSIYNQGLGLINQGKYEEAIAKLTPISDYQDVAEKIVECERNLVSKLSGTWQGNQGSVITLNEDGTCYYVDGSSGEGAGIWYVDKQMMIRIDTEVFDYQLSAVLISGYDTVTFMMEGTGSRWRDEKFVKQ